LEDKIRIGSVEAPSYLPKKGLFYFRKRGGEEDGYRQRHAGERYGHVQKREDNTESSSSQELSSASRIEGEKRKE
jgi:hypothetical protein